MGSNRAEETAERVGFAIRGRNDHSLICLLICHHEYAFSRLKHYRPDEIDPQENHATECLAACLVFSPELRLEFLRFLFGSHLPPVELGDGSDIEIVTQELIEGGKWIDLILRLGEELPVAVEIKVKSPENCDHHRQQLTAYQVWLDKKGGGFLFTLVRDPDRAFPFKDYSVRERRTWRELTTQLTGRSLQIREYADIVSSLKV